MKDKKISIIVPVYNAEKTLERCLNSLINQTYKNIEIICVNDGSTDSSLDILYEYIKEDKRIVIINKENFGPSSARNAGINIAKGGYITFVDSDDWLELNAMEYIYKSFENKYSVVRINYYENMNDKECIQNKAKNKEYVKNDIVNILIKEILTGSIPSYSWLLTINLSKIKKEDCMYDESIPYLEDIEFFIRLLYKCENVCFLDKPLYHYYVNYNGMTKSKKNILKNMKNMLIVHNKLILLLERNNKEYFELRRIPDTLYLNAILNSVFLSLKYDINFKETLMEFMKMIETDQVKIMIDNVNYKLLTFHLRIPIFLIKIKAYKCLLMYYKIRLVFSK